MIAIARTMVRTAKGRSRAVDVDLYAGARLRQRRSMLGLTQKQMADLMGVTYQQAHKYEKGINRMSIGRAHAAATALGIDLNYLVEGIANSETDPTVDPRVIRLSTMWLGLDSKEQAAVLALVKTMAIEEE